jgi:hypothetical protein
MWTRDVTNVRGEECFSATLSTERVGLSLCADDVPINDIERRGRGKAPSNYSL